jgi:hypothetical protein
MGENAMTHMQHNWMALAGGFGAGLLVFAVVILARCPS